jgi:NitT/TauT family transport system substrate-binding protein
MPSPFPAPQHSRRLAAAITAITLAAASGCAAVPATAAPAGPPGPVITVAAVPATGAAGLYIAADKGLFAAAGLNVRIESSVSAAGTIKDLVAGRIQVTLGQWTSALAAEARGTRLRAIASGNSGGPGLEELVTLPGSPVTQLSQLRGKTIAVNAAGGLSQMLTESQLALYGITGSQVRWAVIPFPAMPRALAAHQVTAAFMVEPYLSQAEESLGAATLADLDSGATQDFPVTGYITTAAWASQHPALLAAFTRALAGGQAIAATSRPAVEQALIRHLHITAMTATVMALGTFPLSVGPVQLGRVGDLMQADGLLPRHASIPALARALTAG